MTVTVVAVPWQVLEAKVAKLVVMGLALTVNAAEKPEPGVALHPELFVTDEIETVVEPEFGSDAPAMLNEPVLAAMVILAVVAANVLTPESVYVTVYVPAVSVVELTVTVVAVL